MNNITVFTASWGQLNGRNSNMGDIIIFEAILDILSALKPVKRVYCYSTDPAYTDSRYHVRSTNPFTLRSLLQTIRNIHRSDIVLLGGGELVQTKSSLLYLMANLAPGYLSWIFKKKCLAIGIGIADEDEISRIGKTTARFILNRIDRICVRDRSSFENALSIGIKKDKLALTADLAFHFANTKRPVPRFSNQTILLCPRFTKKRTGSFLPSWLTRKLTRKIHDEDFQMSAREFAELLKLVCRSYKVIILPVYQGRNTSNEDFLFAREIVDAAGFPENVEIYNGAITVHSIFDLMEKIDLAVAVPLHALVMAAIAHKPIMALPYASKCINLMRELKLSDYAVTKIDQDTGFDIPTIQEVIEKCMRTDSHISSTIKQSLNELSRRHDENIVSIKTAIRDLTR